jgi:uncharacterized membrane protein HdeD (DUF308 family)
LSFSLIIGLLFIRRPGEGAVTLTLLLIVFFVVEGFSKVIFHTIRPFANWGWVLANGVVGILLFFLSLANLSVTAIWLLGVLLGIQLISEGLALGYLAWRVRQSDVTNRSDPSLPRTKKRPHAQVNGDVLLVSALSVIDPPGDRDQW